MVLIHGGGGMAFREWVDIWNARGYAAIAMDLSGRDGSEERLPNGGPEQNHEAKFTLDDGWENIWTYHAIAAVARAHSLLRAQPGVDPDRIGATGISWGGYLSCIVAGVDSRFGCVVPVYGCGFLQDNSADEWMRTFDSMPEDERRRWHDLCDPSSYLGDATMPMMFVSGTNDGPYPMDSLQKSYRLPSGEVSLCIRLEMPHSHPDGWAPDDIHMYTDHLFRDGPAMPKLGPTIVSDGRATARVTSERPVRNAYLLTTQELGEWAERKWHAAGAEFDGSTVRAALPRGTTVCYLAVEDEAGAYASSAHAPSAHADVSRSDSSA